MSKFFTTKDYYFKTFKIAIPLALQMLLASCMGIIDTMMVSSINMVTAVGNAALITTLSDGIGWGIISGIAMFASQFYGAKQDNNLKKSFGLCLLLSIGNALIWILVSYIWGKELLLFYLNDQEVLVYSLRYLLIACIALIPMAINSSFQVLYRSTHQTNTVLYASIIGAFLNIVLNYLLIFVFKLHVEGAALATLLAQSILTIFYIMYSLNTKQSFIGSFNEIFNFDLNFVKPIVFKMLPLMINESLYGFGQTLFIKAFGVLGSNNMEAYYVSNQIYQIFAYIVYGYGGAVSILIGTRLGEGKIDKAKEESNYQIGLGFVIACILSVLMIVFAPNLVSIFTLSSPIIVQTTIYMLYVFAFKVFLRMFNFIMFSTLRAGGDAKVLNILDSGILYVVGLPSAFIAVYMFKIDSLVLVLLITQIEQIIRIIFTIKRYIKGVWAKDLTKLVEA